MSSTQHISGIIGAIYPVPERFKERLFDGKVKVFVKFLARKSTRLSPGHKVIFYGSRASGKLIGEGVIEKVEFLTAERVLTKYRDLLFLNEGEFRSYVESSPVPWESKTEHRESKEMLTLVLGQLREYREPIKYHRRMTTAGQYLTAEDYKSIAGNEQAGAT